MDVLTGILLDVSGSMEASIGDRHDGHVGEIGSSWAKSIFRFIDRLIKHDASSDHRVFAIGFGSSRKQVTFDVLTTLKRLEMDKTLYRSKRDMLSEMMAIIETNGAPRIRHWTTVEEINGEIDEHQTAVLLNALKYSSDFRNNFIYELLPASCRKVRNLSKRDTLTEAMKIMEKNGAPRVHKWATVDEINAQIDDRTTDALFDGLTNHPEFRRQFIDECLPDECKIVVVENDGVAFAAGTVGTIGALPLLLTPAAPVGVVLIGASWLLPGFRKEIANNTVGHIPKVHKSMTENSIKDVIRKGMDLAVAKGIFVPVKDIISGGINMVGNYILAEVENQDAVYSAKDASEILHGCVGEQELTERRTSELFERVEPFIYGGTPLMKSLRQAVSLFKENNVVRDNRKSQYKLLFVLSDGDPADGRNPPISKLDELGVKVICCYITNTPIDEPRRLYSKMPEEWEVDAKFMFGMSSVISTEKIPRTIFVKKGWKIDIDNNETRMYFQINHPDIINEVCNLAKECVCSQDSLADVLSSVSLDMYINKANEGLSPDCQKDKEKTCYAIASATVIHMALMRIVGREGGYPGFYQIRDELINMYGVKAAVVREVLRETCPRYRLQCKMTDERGALCAIVEKRPVVAIFQLSDAEWRSFYKFYQPNPRGTLTKDHLNIDVRPHGAALRGHAVVLTSFNSESLRLMNSKGSGFADGGFFKVKNAAVLGMKFYDVFWTEKENILPSEKEAYRRHGADIKAKLMKSLISLQTATYKCPVCSVQSNVSEFTGHLSTAVCPRCEGTFNASDENQSDLALSIYLTSLLSRDAEAE